MFTGTGFPKCSRVHHKIMSAFYVVSPGGWKGWKTLLFFWFSSLACAEDSVHSKLMGCWHTLFYSGEPLSHRRKIQTKHILTKKIR